MSVALAAYYQLVVCEVHS